MSLKASHQDVNLLPSYNDVITGRQADSNNAVRSSVQDEVHDELLSLAIRFDSIQGQKLHQLQRDDERALDLLVPHVKAFLAEYSERTLPMATLILIPAGAVDPLAVPADDDLRSADDFGRVITVRPEKGGDAALWDTADVAERLASYLRPPSDDVPARQHGLPSSPRPEAASFKRAFWRKKPTAGAIAPPAAVKTADLPRVTMAVEAEEVVFRAESELGLYENQTVWGIVVRVRVHAVGHRR